MTRILTALAAALLIVLVLPAPGLAQAPPPQAAAQPELAGRGNAQGQEVPDETPDWYTQIEQLRRAGARLPLAAGLATLLAMRPRRRGTPRRQLPVIQTQIILAIVGAVVMLVVGSSLARAFGIVGAAGLVRYRAKINDPKDAGVMLSTLAIGLASGVGLWLLASFATAFVLAVLWIVESFEPKARQLFMLTVKAKDPAALKPEVEKLLTRARLEFELRTASTEEICYEVHMPIERKTDRLSNTILELDRENATAVEWEEKKEKA